VGGDADGGFGTDPERIRGAIEDLEADEVLVFMDLGSAVLSAETVLEMLSSEKREQVRLVDAPFVEGAFAAGVVASTPRQRGFLLSSRAWGLMGSGTKRSPEASVSTWASPPSRESR
jgi:hypothetical protein